MFQNGDLANVLEYTNGFQDRFWKSTRKSQRRRLATNFAISINLGVSWAFGFLALIPSDPTVVDAFGYTFAILTSLQGTLFFTCGDINIKFGQKSFIMLLLAGNSMRCANPEIISIPKHAFQSGLSGDVFENIMKSVCSEITVLEHGNSRISYITGQTFMPRSSTIHLL